MRTRKEQKTTRRTTMSRKFKKDETTVELYERTPEEVVVINVEDGSVEEFPSGTVTGAWGEEEPRDSFYSEDEAVDHLLDEGYFEDLAETQARVEKAARTSTVTPMTETERLDFFRRLN
jgi:hypothetical protein